MTSNTAGLEQLAKINPKTVLIVGLIAFLLAVVMAVVLALTRPKGDLKSTH